MLDLRRFIDSDYKDYEVVVDFINQHYENTNGEYYTFIYNDEERVLYKTGDIYTIYFYNKDTDSIDFIMFNYDEEQKQIYVNLGNYILHKSETSEVLEDGNGIIHYLNVVQGKEDYSGYAYYSQYDNKKDISCVQFYDHHYMPNSDVKQRIYDMRLHNPSKIAIRHNSSKKMNKAYMPINTRLYAKIVYDEDGDGLLYNILKNETNNKYYRIVACTKEGNLLYVPIITNGYNDEEMKSLIKSYGFSIDVPDELVRVYNGDGIDTSYFWDLVKEEKELNKEVNVLVKKGG